MWWFAALHANLLMAYRRYASPTAGARLLDAGCGTGGLLARLAGASRARRRLDADAGGLRAGRGEKRAPGLRRVGQRAALCRRGVRRDLQRRRAVPPRRRRAARAGAIPPLPRRRRHARPQPAGLSLDDVAARRGGLQCAALHRGGVVALLRAAGFRPLFASYWNMLLFPLMVLTRKLLPAARGSDVRQQPAIGRGDRAGPPPASNALLIARRHSRCPSAARCWRSPRRSRAAMSETRTDASRCRSSSRSITAPTASASWSPRSRRWTIAGGHEIVLVNDGSPDDSLAVCRGLVARARVPITLVEPVAQLRRAQRGDGRAAPRPRRPCHHHGRRSAEPAGGGRAPARLSPRRAAREVIYTYYDEKQHARWRNLGSRFTNWVAGFVLDKPKGFYLSSFRCMSAFVVREITRYEGPFPYVDGLILQVTQNIDRLLVTPSAARGRAQQLHAAAAVAAVAQHVRQFLGHAAADQHLDRVRAERVGRARRRSRRSSRRCSSRRRRAGPR